MSLAKPRKPAKNDTTLIMFPPENYLPKYALPAQGSTIKTLAICIPSFPKKIGGEVVKKITRLLMSPSPMPNFQDSKDSGANVSNCGTKVLGAHPQELPNPENH